MEHHPCRLVTWQTKLALQQERRNAALICGHQVGRPKPHRQRSSRALEDRARCQGNLVPTTGTLPATKFHQFISIPAPTSWTHDAVWPAAGDQILLARLFTDEFRLEFIQVLRKSWTRHTITLP